MEPIRITRELYEEKEEYCKFSNLPRGDFLSACRDNPIYFMTHMVGMKPFTWQYLVLKSYLKGNRRFVICTSRQIGKSKLLVILDLWRLIFNHGYKDNMTFKNSTRKTFDCIISRGDDQASMLLDEMRAVLQIGDEYMSQYKNKDGKSIFGTKWFTEKLHYKLNNQTTIAFTKGMEESLTFNMIKSFPPTDKILGNSFTGVGIDEAARVDDYIITEVAQPTYKALGKMFILISTPMNPTGYFYEALDPDDKYQDHSYERFMFDVDAIEIDDPEYHASVLTDIAELRKYGRENEVMRNYYCSFTTSEDLYFDLKKVKDCFDDSLDKHSSYRERPVIVGVDFGGTKNSHTVITVVTFPDEYGYSKRISCWRYPINGDGDVIKDIQESIIPNFSVSVIVPEKCAASTIAIQNMVQKGWNVKPFDTNSKTKEDYVHRFRVALHEGRLRSYPDSVLMEEFVNFRDIMKPRKGYTDDCIDSWWLSCTPFLDSKEQFEIHVIDSSPRDETPDEYDLLEQTAIYDGESIKQFNDSYEPLSRAI